MRVFFQPCLARRPLLHGALRLVLLACLAGFHAIALDPGRRITQYGHETWQREQGLPQNSVWAIAQTPDGYLWCATEEGLARFDGVAFTVFHQGNTPEITHSCIQALMVDRQGTLWVGMKDGGICRRRQGRFERVEFKGNAPGMAVRCFLEDRAGSLWVGTEGGLLQVTGTTCRSYGSGDGLSSPRVLALRQDRRGRLWVGTARGLDVFTGHGFSPAGSKELAGEFVVALCEDAEGALWIGSLGGGVWRLKEGVAFPFGPKTGWPQGGVHTVMTDRAGSLWIGSRHSGLGRLRNGRFEALVAAQGLTDNAVLSLFEDREGSLWIGTVGGGLNRLRDTPFLTLGTAEGLSGGLFSALLEGRDGSLWVGSIGSGALQRIHDGKVTQFGKKEGLTSDVILSLAEGPAGVLWVGTDSGLNQVKKGVLRTFTKKQGLLSNVVFSLLEGRDGSLWIGTLHGGIDHLKDGRITSFAKAEGLQNDQVHCLLEGREGDLWIGTRGGLSHLKNGIISTVATRKELGAEAVFALFEDTDGALWIGTEGGGLARLLEGKIASITTKAGLFHDTVFTILDDGLGHFWMSCNKGVFRASKRDLAAVANGSTRTLKCIPYGIPDGMLSAECNGGIQPAGWKARDGRLWFPTTRGLAMVDPTQVGMNTLPPPVHIEAVQVDQESMDLSRPVRIPPGRHNLDIRYTALSFLVPGRVRFKYRLEGFDPEWVEAGTRRTAYYTHLPPGTFRFRVLACNNDGVWNLEGAALAFKVEPHFYQTWLFYGLCAVAAVVSGALVQRHFQRVRIHNLEMENRVLDERHRLARDVHDQLSQTMTGVVLQLEAASHALTLEPARCRPYMDRAMQLAREGMAETRRTIKGLRATVLDQGDLRHALESIGPQLTDGTGVRVEVRQEGSPFPLSSRTEDNLFRVGQEAITNALRHGRTHQIEIVLKWEDRGVRLTIHDHGRGMEAPLDPSSPSRGLGLGGMRDRISADHGTLTVGNSPEGGARVEAFVPRRDS